ncbi:MAG: hypoxanthine phosphoribosyltransferase [Bacteriovoracaceae bacterium]|nr:hypoxanthine phosphoribosyltransferase [Bacteriovoracaceae bacterium]
MMSKDFKVLIHEKEIGKRVHELGAQISEHYKKKGAECLYIIGVLKGSFIFLSDLVRSLSIPCEIDFLEASSYGASTVSSGEVKLVRDIRFSIKDRDVLIVEDILDTGHTMEYLLKHLSAQKPKSLSICSFLDKPSRRKTAVKADFLGFTIDDHFVIGYGLDFNNRYREVRSVVIYEPN